MARPSPVIQADVKLLGDLRMLCVDVRFRSRSELNGLIQALTALRDAGENDADHFHLQDARLQSKDVVATEVTFYRPRKRRDDAVSLAVSRARRLLSDLKQR